jgi:GNAT superfamily N-acetyltransferase
VRLADLDADVEARVDTVSPTCRSPISSVAVEGFSRVAPMAADPRARRGTVDDAHAIAGLLDDFNTEFDEPSPGVEVLETRLGALLAEDRTFALISGAPPVAVALVTLRPNVWYAGQVALLDELYVVPERRGQGIGSALVTLLLSTARAMSVDLVEINVDEGDVDARRFYERHGFTATAPDSTERSFYYWRELTA